jgi:hypothetical protein
MSTIQQGLEVGSSPSSSVKIIRIITAIQVIRLAGIQLFIKVQSGIFPGYFAYPFGVGDLFVGLLALPIAYSLRSGGIRKYALSIAWNSVGLADLFFALTVASYAGLNSTIMTDLQTALVVVPVSIVLHILTIALLLTSPVKLVFLQTRQ